MFRYGEPIRITGGHFKGCTGTIVDKETLGPYVIQLAEHHPVRLDSFQSVRWIHKMYIERGSAVRTVIVTVTITEDRYGALRGRSDAYVEEWIRDALNTDGDVECEFEWKRD